MTDKPTRIVRVTTFTRTGQRWPDGKIDDALLLSVVREFDLTLHRHGDILEVSKPDNRRLGPDVCRFCNRWIDRLLLLVLQDSRTAWHPQRSIEIPPPAAKSTLPDWSDVPNWSDISDLDEEEQ